MLDRYEFRLDHTDGTHEVLSVEAASIGEAKAQVSGLGQVTTLLCIISAAKQECLAW